MSQTTETDTNRITAAEVKGWADKLDEYQSVFHPLFKRKEQRQHADDYMRGLLHPLPNKAIETMVLHTKGDDSASIRAMQHFISEGAWDDRAVLQRHCQMVDETVGDEEGVLIVDGTGFPKQGDQSVGVKRQWCGQLGKVANCQVGVFLGYASRHGRTLLDRRLYLPREWVEDEAYAERRQRTGVPQNVQFQTKPQLAAEMVTELAASETLRYGWLTADEAFGRDSHFLDQVGAHLWYFAEVPLDTPVWQQRPATQVPPWRGRGRTPTRRQLKPGEARATTVAAITAHLPTDQWHRHVVKEGTKGTIVADFAAVRVVNSRQQLPGEEVWLVCRRNITTGELKYFLSNAPVATTLATFATISGMRWPIETCFEEGKQDLGLGDYQVRSWTGWHHHMTLVILAHFFLVRVGKETPERASRLTLPQAILLLKSVLPQPKFDVETTLEIVNYYQDRHEAARRSHSKRRSARIERLE